MFVNVNGVWKKGRPWVNISGVWKKSKAVWVNISGVWKKMSFDAVFDVSFNTVGFATLNGTVLKIPYTLVQKGESLIEGFEAELNIVAGQYTEDYIFHFPYDIANAQAKEEARLAVNRLISLYSAGDVTINFRVLGEPTSHTLNRTIQNSFSTDQPSGSSSRYKLHIKAKSFNSDATMYNYLMLSKTKSKVVTVTLQDSTA